MHIIITSLAALAPLFVPFLLLTPTEASTPCTKLPTVLEYDQIAAPTNVSSVLLLVLDNLNTLGLSEVESVSISWAGEDFLSGQSVGLHYVKTEVLRENAAQSGSESGECFEVGFRIVDTDECSLPRSSPHAHKCHPSAKCVNTPETGGYDCVCNHYEGDTSDPWQVSFSDPALTTCPGVHTTSGCCSSTSFKEDSATSCRRGFVCPVDECTTNKNVCDRKASCRKSADPLNGFECLCPANTYGNGLPCSSSSAKKNVSVGFDGKLTPQTEMDLENDEICGCQSAKVDNCVSGSGESKCDASKNEVCEDSGNGAECVCIEGFVRNDEYGCVDMRPPQLKLQCLDGKGDDAGNGVTTLTQGETYKECGVDILDRNSESYDRKLQIKYVKTDENINPTQQLGSCLKSVGTFDVVYTVSTPWTTPSSVSVTRTVKIKDLDECALSPSHSVFRTCPELVTSRCDSLATCKNTNGSFMCECKKCSSGDGFLPLVNPKKVVTPTGYRGGTGCKDSCAPNVKLVGGNPKVFKVCKCGGGILGTPGDDQSDNGDGKALYESQLKQIIAKNGNRNELCDSDSSSGSLCSTAVDYSSRQNREVENAELTRNIIVGEPVYEKSGDTNSFKWRVPYSVSDEAGNASPIVYRDVIVKEMSLSEMEADLKREYEKKQEEAVKEAVRTERARAEKHGAGNKVSRNGRLTECPTCPDCKANTKTVSKTAAQRELVECQETVRELQSGKTVHDDNNNNNAYNMSVINTIAPPLLLVVFFLALISIFTLYFQQAKKIIDNENKGSSRSSNNNSDVAGGVKTPTSSNKNMMDSVTYHSPRHGSGSRGNVSVHSDTSNHHSTPSSASPYSTYRYTRSSHNNTTPNNGMMSPSNDDIYSPTTQSPGSGIRTINPAKTSKRR